MDMVLLIITGWCTFQPAQSRSRRGLLAPSVQCREGRVMARIVSCRRLGPMLRDGLKHCEMADLADRLLMNISDVSHCLGREGYDRCFAVVAGSREWMPASNTRFFIQIEQKESAHAA